MVSSLNELKGFWQIGSSSGLWLGKFFGVEVGDRQLTLLVAVYISSSCVISQWWPKFMVKTNFHVNKTIYKWVGCDGEY
jgi:hypothetical protein